MPNTVCHNCGGWAEWDLEGPRPPRPACTCKAPGTAKPLTAAVGTMTVEHASDVTVSVHANLKTGPCSHCGKPTELTSIAVERLTLGKPVYCDACKNSPSVPFVPGCPHGWAAPSICLRCSPVAAELSAFPLVPTPDELELLGQLRGILAHGGKFPSHQCLNCTARLPVCQHSWTVVEPIGGVLWCGRCGALGPAKLPRLPRSYVQCVAHAHIYDKAETDAG